ncbi:MAG: TRAP transporter small permease [Armatimonadota bacterium]
MLIKIWNNLEEILGSILLSVICITVTIQLASRYLLKNPFAWTEELSTITFTWLVMIGSSLALKKREHFAVEVVIDKLPPIIAAYARAFATSLVIIFSIIVLWFGMRFAIAGTYSITATLELPSAVPYSAIAFGGLLMLARSIEMFISDIKTAKAIKMEVGK